MSLFTPPFSLSSSLPSLEPISYFLSAATAVVYTTNIVTRARTHEHTQPDFRYWEEEIAEDGERHRCVAIVFC
jgi:hypothetical protein